MTAALALPMLCLIALAAGILLWIAAMIADDNQRLRAINGRMRPASGGADAFPGPASGRVLVIPVSAVAIAAISVLAAARPADPIEEPPQRRLIARTVSAPHPAPPPQAPVPAGATAPAWAAGVVCDPVPLEELRLLAEPHAAQQGLDRGLLLALIYRESRFRPCAVSPSGAIGLMQLKPATARLVGVANPFDAAENIGGGARYLREMVERYGGDMALALSAYKQGPGTIGGVRGQSPTEHTQRYVRDILDLAQALD